MTLIVPTPVLKQKGAEENVFASEKPVCLFCEDVTFQDGTVVPPESLREHGFRLFRRTVSGLNEVWDDAEDVKEWKPEDAANTPSPLGYLNNKWQSVLVAIGQKDKNDHLKFSTTPGTQYFIRCSFRAVDASGQEHVGFSPDSQFFTVLEAGANNQAGLMMDPEAAAEATAIWMYLKDDSFAEGRVSIIRQGDKCEVHISANGALFKITAEGDIVMTTSGRSVIINGDVMVEGNVSAHNIP
jgi:hypothetical protein